LSAKPACYKGGLCLFLGYFFAASLREITAGMNVIQKPDLFCFSSALGDIVIGSAVGVTVAFSDGTDEFLQEAYTPDSEGRIYVRELERLLVPHISKITLRQHFLITVTPVDGSEGAVIETTVQYCLTEVNLAAEAFLESCFLTTLRGEKVTYAGQREFLSLVVSEATEVSITARYRNGGQSSKTAQIAAGDAGKAVTVDVSPSLFSAPDTVSFVVVTAGARAFTFYVRRLPAARPVEFVFLNPFGVKETFVPAGLVSRENRYENRFGYFGGMYRKYSVDLVKLHTANTGVMTGDMADWIECLFLSGDVFVLSPAGVEQEVTIEESTVRRSSARDELPSCEFKYRLSKRNHDEFYVLTSRIFDGTFDYTFN
jgi:hypothetical protein